MINIFYDVVLQLYLFTLGTLAWAEMALIKKVTEKKVMFKSILSKVSHSMHKRLKFQKFSERGITLLGSGSEWPGATSDSGFIFEKKMKIEVV